MFRPYGLALALVALVSLPLAPPPALAQAPGAPPVPAPAPPPVRADSTRTHHFWARPWIELGGGWLATPDSIHSQYQSGQSLGVGLEARPAARLAIRSALDYQFLFARSAVTMYLDQFGDGSVIDTSRVEIQTTAWVLTNRTELGVMLLRDVWLTGGAGGGYMKSGLEGIQNATGSTIQVVTDGRVSNGWGWLWTASLRYEFTPGPRVPLGLEVRTESLHRRHDTLGLWSVRLSLRMPEGPAPGGRRGHGDGRGGR